MKQFLQFLKPYKWLLIVAVFFGIVKYIFPLILPFVMKVLIDDVFLNEGMLLAEKKEKIMFLSFAVIALILFTRPIVEFFRQKTALTLVNKVIYDVRKTCVEHLFNLPIHFFKKRKSGDIITRLIIDVEQTKQFILTGLLNIWLDIFSIVIVLFFMFSMNVKLTLVSMMVLPIYVILVVYFQRKLKEKTKKESEETGEFQSFLFERVQGVRTFKLLTKSENEKDRFDKKNKKLFRIGLNRSKWFDLSMAIIRTLTEVAPFIVVYFGVLMVINEKVTVGTMIAFVGFLERMYRPLKRLVEALTDLSESLGSMERVAEFLNEKQEDDGKIAKKTFNNSIQMQGVDFSYPEDDKQIVKNLELTIKKGEKVAFVGESGGGKSTLMQLLIRFYDPTKGIIKIDGVDIKTMNVDSLRSLFGVVFQENVLFNESIEENLLLAHPKATKKEIVDACKKAKAHDFIENFPNGYGTKVGERGVKLSGGQKQRLALARVILKNPEILILDEATSALDLKNEWDIQQELSEIMKEKTAIIIAHRISTIKECDKIVVIENGEIKNIGTYDEIY